MNEHPPEVCPFEPDHVVGSTIWADADCSLITNIAPILPGHSLVIPRRHVTSLLDLSEEELRAFFLFARAATRLLVTVFQADAFNWSLQDGVPAGQTVGHLHLHIIPRYDGDLAEPGDWYPKLQQKISDDRGQIDSADRPKLSDEQLKTVALAIRERARRLGVLPPSGGALDAL